MTSAEPVPAAAGETVPSGLAVWLDWRPGDTGGPAHHRELVALCERAEQLGYAAVWVSEHHCLDDGYLTAPLAALAALSVRTERIALGTGVLLAPLRSPRLLVEEAIFVQDLSGGRLLLGLGAGYWPPEFEALGVSMAARGRSLDRVVRDLAAAGSGVLTDGWPVTPPARPIPLVLGGSTDAALRRAVRHAAAYFAAANFDYRLAAVRGRQMREVAEQVGRPAPHMLAGINLWVTDDPDATWAGPVGEAYRRQIDGYVRMGLPAPTLPDSGSDLLDAGLLIGPAERIVTALAELAATVPLTQLCFWARPPGISHHAAVDNLERIAAEVAPHLRDALVRNT